MDGIKQLIKEYIITDLVSVNHAVTEYYGRSYLEIDLTDCSYEDVQYCNIRNSICDLKGRVMLAVKRQDIFLANRLLWECENIRVAYYVDLEDPYAIERDVTRRDSLMWDIQAGLSESNDKELMSGWKNSYDNSLFDAEEIREYKENTYKKLLPYTGKEKSALEIGCGSGMISDVLSGLFRRYDGCDISKGILDKLREMNKKNNISNMELFQCEADRISSLNRKYDVVLSSSVTEYFSGYNYLRKVVLESIESIDERGVVYFGDVFDLGTKKEYMDSVRAYSQEHPTAQTSKSFSFELFVPVGYWYDIYASDSRITGVEVSRKIGQIDNEINKYRYDVLINVDKKQKENRKKTKTYLSKYQIGIGHENYS